MAFQAHNDNPTFLIMKTPLTTKPKIVLVQWNKQHPLVVMPEGDVLPMVVKPTIVDTADPSSNREETVDSVATPIDADTKSIITEKVAEQPKSKPKKNGNLVIPEFIRKKLPARSCKKVDPVIETSMKKTAPQEPQSHHEKLYPSTEKSAQKSIQESHTEKLDPATETSKQNSQRRPRKSFTKFLNDNQQNIYTRLDKNLYRCNLCNILKSRQYIIAHVRDVHSELRLHKCNVCNKSFKRAYSLSLHSMTHQTELRSTYICDLCSYKTMSRASFKSHYNRLHTNQRKFRCEHCDKEFKSKREVSAHIISHGEANDMCEICGKMYRGIHLLRAHVRTHHFTGEFTCEICKKKLSCLKALNEHMKLHSRVFECDDCGAKYPTKVRLIKHRNTHTRENSFRCQVCGKVFATEMIQRIHSLSHAGVKPYRCNVCGRGFTQRSPMMYHWRTQHPEETELPPHVPLKSILKSIEDKKKKEAQPLYF